MLLTESYREQQSRLHEAGSYGWKGHHYAQDILDLATALRTQDILDYGCGHGTLQEALGFRIKQYDPCIPRHAGKPAPADIVVCTDVLEHIEPECLDAVLDDLKGLAKKLGFFAIDTRPARKTLVDGRNAHLIQERASWWFPKLYERWATVQVMDILYRPDKSLGLVAVVRAPRAVVTTNEGRS